MHILTFCLAAPAMMRSFGMVLGITFSGTVAVAAIANVFLLQAYFPSDVSIIYSFNNVSWTISIEMLFYTLFPFIAIGVGKIRKRMSREMLIFVMLSLWLGVIGGNILLPSYVVSLPFFRLSEFMIGVCAALIFMDHMKDKKKVFLGAHDTLVELISLTLLAINVLLYPFVAHRLSVIAFLAPSLTLLIFVFSQSNGHVARFLSHKILVFLGEISFSFYMLHHLILNHITPERTMLGVIVALVTATAASAIAYVFFEEPIRLRIKTYLEKRIEKLA
jgi:peptidoglycan/LPS O-acetylase OafA/YrhL